MYAPSDWVFLQLQRNLLFLDTQGLAFLLHVWISSCTIVGSTWLLFLAIFINKADPGPKEGASPHRSKLETSEDTVVGLLLFCITHSSVSSSIAAEVTGTVSYPECSFGRGD